MNQEVKSEWVAALRSGEYAQCTGTLHREDEDGRHSFCCLGVLTDVLVKKGVVTPNVVRNKLHIGTFDYSYDHESGVLPKAVQEAAGLERYNPEVLAPFGEEEEDLPPLHMSLAELNDGGKTFEEIADLIEEQL